MMDDPGESFATAVTAVETSSPRDQQENNNDINNDDCRKLVELKKSTRISIKREDKFRRLIKRKSTVVKNGGDDQPKSESQSEDAVSNDNVVKDDSHVEGQETRSFELSDNVFQEKAKEKKTTSPAPVCKEDIDVESTDFNETLYSWGSSFASFMGNVSKQALSGAISVVKTSLQYMPDAGSLADDDDDDDVMDQWHDAQFAESSSENDSDFEDAVQQLQPRDRIHNICHELLTTEESYVTRLAVLVMAKQKTTKILGEDIAKGMFRDIETVHQFHSHYLLPQLQERLNFWEKYKRIGDIMAKFTPFLKLYTEYVKNFESASALVDTWVEKSSKFAALLKEVQDIARAGRNRLQAHMLEPVQRVPRYELLLRDYLKRLDPDAADRADTEKALELVAKAALHFEEMMQRDSQVGQLMQLQRQMDGAVSLVGGNRKLLKKGKVSTLSAKSEKKGDRIAFLFTDQLVICAEHVIGVTKYKVKHVFLLSEVQTADGNNLDFPHTFYIKTTEKVVEICFNGADEKREWEEALVKQMKENTKKKLVRQGSTRVNDKEENRASSLGRQAPVLVRQSDATMCMICASEFSALRRKRHCRACGIVVCAKCSSHSAILDYDRTKALRVCDECFVLLSDRTDSVSHLSPAADPHSILTRTKSRGDCLEKGFLLYSSDTGKTWKRRWFTLHSGAMLYSFKAPQDINPITSMCLDGYEVELGVHSSRKSGQVLILKGMGKVYLLHDDGADSLSKWYAVLEGQGAGESTKNETAEATPPLTANESVSLVPLQNSQTKRQHARHVLKKRDSHHSDEDKYDDDDDIQQDNDS